jgi:glycyl-tRNA synthetase beta chain
MSTHNILFELGCEELPPKSLKTLRDALQSLMAQGLSAQGLTYQKIKTFAAPRRLAFQIIELVTEQPDKRIERRGPAIQAAFDAQGQPTQAAKGFARGLGRRGGGFSHLKDR